jgi:peptidyl-prolyl cis-trans isomerase D
LQDEQREVRYALLQPEAFGAGPPIEAGAIEAYYNANAALYTPPEGVKLAFAELTLADVAATVQVSEEDLRARYERDKSVFVEPERRRARHILISVDGGTDDAKASAQAKDLRARVTADNFAALAKEFSKDSASAAEGGILDWSGREAYVVPFADALFALQEGEISQPVKTQFGYHLIKLEGVRAGSARTFDDVRGELMATLRTEVAADEFGNRQEQLQERVESGAGDLAQLVQEFGLRRGEVEHFERGNGGLPLGSDVGLNEAVFSDAVLNQRRVGGPIQLGEDRLTVVQVIDHQLPKLKPLSEVRDAVTAALIRQRGETGAAKTAEVALARLSAGESFDKVLADLKIKAEPARFVGRGEPDLPVELRDAAFAMSKPVAGKPARRSLAVEGGAAALLEVTAVRAELTSTNAQLLSVRAQREQQRYSLRDVEAYLSELVKSAKVSKNSQAFQ